MMDFKLWQQLKRRNSSKKTKMNVLVSFYKRGICKLKKTVDNFVDELCCHSVDIEYDTYLIFKQ